MLRCGLFILLLLLAGCTLDPLYLRPPSDDGSVRWVVADSQLAGYAPVSVTLGVNSEPAFVCRAYLTNQGYTGFQVGELRGGQCLVADYGQVRFFDAPNYEQLLIKTGLTYHWAALEEFTARPLLYGPLYTNNRVAMPPITTLDGVPLTIWMPCAVFYDARWRAGKIDTRAREPLCYIATDRGVEMPVTENVLVLYAPAR